MADEKMYVVDRIEGELVVLVDDESGEKENLGSWELPPADEGTVLAVQLDDNGNPKWGTVTILHDETERRAAEGERTVEDLNKRDPGGDISL